MLWAVATGLALGFPHSPKQLEFFCQTFWLGSMFVTFGLRRWAPGCALSFLAYLVLANVAPHLHMPGFWNVPIALWAGPLTLIAGLQLATGGVSLATLLLNLAGYALVVAAAAAAGARHYLFGLLLGWAILVLTALAMGWLQQHGRLADRCALAVLILLSVLGIFLPEAVYRYHPEWMNLPPGLSPTHPS